MNRKSWLGEVCDRCGRRNTLVWSVSDDVWKKVVGDEDIVWCLTCFDESAQIKNVKYELDKTPKLQHLYWYVWSNE